MTVKVIYSVIMLAVLASIIPFVGVILVLPFIFGAPFLLIHCAMQPRPTKWYKPQEYAAAVVAGLLLAWAGYACIVNS